MDIEKIKFASQFMPLPLIYLLYFPVYEKMARINIHTAEWYSSGSILAVGVLVGLFIYLKLLSVIPAALISMSLIGCGAYSSYQYSLFLGAKLESFSSVWGAYQWLSTLPWHQTIPLYLGPILVGGLCLKLLATNSGASNWLPKVRKKEKSTSTKFGSAEFMTYKEVKKINSAKGLPVGFAINPPNDELKTIKEEVEKTKQNPKELIRIESEHLLLIAPSGTGKGTGFILPSLMDYDGPVFVCDPKHGENYAIAKRRRKAMGRKVVLLDPFDIHQGQGRSINIIDIVRCSDDTQAIEASAEFAKLICPVINDSGKESHFDKFGSTVIQCMILYVAFSKNIPNHERNIFKVYDLICATKDELYGPDNESKKKTDNEASRLEDAAPDSQVAGLLQAIVDEKEIAGGRASRIASKALGTDYRESSGYFSTAYRELEFLDTPVMQEHMSYSDFDMRDILKGDTDVFVAMPSEKIKTYPNYMRVMIGFALLCIQRAGGYKGDKNIKLILDEFAAFGHISSIANNLVLLRSYGLNIFGVVQNIELLKKAYPDDLQSFLSCSMSIFLAPEDPDTCEFITKKLGNKTIAVGSENIGLGSSKKTFSLMKDSSSDQEGLTLSETSRPLLMSDEVRRLGKDISLVFVSGEAPILLKKINYYSFKPWQDMFDPNPFLVPGFRAETDQVIQAREELLEKKSKPRRPVIDVEKNNQNNKSNEIEEKITANSDAQSGENEPDHYQETVADPDDVKNENLHEPPEELLETTDNDLWSEVEEVEANSA